MELQARLAHIAGVQHDKVGEIEHLFQAPGADVQQHAHPAGDALEIPDMAHRGGQLNVAHALPAHLGAGDLHTALVADLVLVLELDTLIFPAVALPVLGGSENALAVQAVPLGLEGTVVDGFRLGDLPVGPGKNLLRGSHTDLDGVQVGQFKQKGSRSLRYLSHRCAQAHPHHGAGGSAAAPPRHGRYSNGSSRSMSPKSSTEKSSMSSSSSSPGMFS